MQAQDIAYPNILKVLQRYLYKVNTKLSKEKISILDYRDSLLQNEKLIVVSARLKLALGHAEKIRQVTNENLNHRLKTQPYKRKPAAVFFAIQNL